MKINIGLIAGEASGDMLAGHLLSALKSKYSNVSSFGIGGANMRAQGFDTWADIERLSVRGYLEVLPRLPELLWLRYKTINRLIKNKPDIFIGVDAPDFNFTVEEKLKNAGIPTIHYVSPSFWAWRAEKLLKLKRAADYVLCVFDFEPELLKHHGIKSSFVGHPLASLIEDFPDRNAARNRLNIDENKILIGLLPGSRAAEIQFLGRRFINAAKFLEQKIDNVEFILPTLEHLVPKIKSFINQDELSSKVHLTIGNARDALRACDIAICASGTVTLEAALLKCPMVIAYAMPDITYEMMKKKQLLPWIGLPNILCAPRDLLLNPDSFKADLNKGFNKDFNNAPFIVPELIQDEANPRALANEVLSLLDNPARMENMQQSFINLHKSLKRNTAEEIVNAIEKII